MKTVNIHEAKTHLSALLAEVTTGEEITIAKNGNPIARLVPISPGPPRKPGRFRGRIVFHESAFAPLGDKEITEWEEGHPSDPLSGLPGLE
ncbi:MAG: type II toxin-antitoxin system prevent-host-death family antitoxin [Verrucomicrobiales bacterium]|nr:type II toxin-antitoxin system prevent-host-death family antitoxin [Verrucomicrobiales bacterium]